MPLRKSHPRPSDGGPGRLLAWQRAVRGLGDQRYLAKWLILGGAIGVVAGLGAVLFSRLIGWCTSFFLGGIVGYFPPLAAGEGDWTALLPMARPWLLPLVTALGGLLSGLLVYFLAPEAEGHGTDAAIEAIHHKRARLRARVIPVKLIASAITIGSGGSAGREGPTAQVSAGFGSLLAQWLNLDIDDRRIAVSAGMGAGIGAIFRAPLGGALMASEVLYIHDLEAEAILPSLMASITSYTVYGLIEGFTPIFGVQPHLGFDHPVQLLYYAGLGVICGLVGLLFARSFYGMAALWKGMGLPGWLKPSLGGLLVGLIGIVLPAAIHSGYGYIQLSMTDALLSFPLWVVLALPFVRILTTSLSIGSGGSGGIFGPGMFIGGMLGAAVWRLAHGLPLMPVEPAPFIIIGMMATFGSIAHAPLAMMLMVAEMTGNLALLAPAMVAVAVATALVGDERIYRSQLPNRAGSPLHRVRSSFPLLASLLVQDAMTPPGQVARAAAPVASVLGQMEAADAPGVVVLNEKNEVVGALSREQIARLSEQERMATPAGRAIGPNPVVLEPRQPLDRALERLAGRGLSWAPVAEGRRLVGALSIHGVMLAYKASLENRFYRTPALPPETSFFEARVGVGSPLAGQTLAEAGFPPHTLVVSLLRDGESIFPGGSTRLEVGDVLMLATDPAGESAVRAHLEQRNSGKGPA